MAERNFVPYIVVRGAANSTNDDIHIAKVEADLDGDTIDFAGVVLAQQKEKGVDALDADVWMVGNQMIIGSVYTNPSPITA